MTEERTQHPLLSRIQSPDDLRRLEREQLPALAEEIRAELLDVVLRNGGHLGSNLGAVEITLALHRVFDFRRDRLVFDVSHQVYTHKLLTGRRARFHTLRQSGGITGFCCKEESEYDLFTAGHAGTAISAALGLACADAADPALRDRHVVALVGDAGIGCGVAFEGLNNAAPSKRRMIIVLNDNEWSISKSVGALSFYLSRIRTSPLVARAERRISELLSHLPVVGDRLEQALEILRHLAVPGHVFEELGVRYIGPLDGHDVHLVVDTLERVKVLDGVTLVHLLTQKGRGYTPASSDPQRAHGISPKAAPKKVEAEAPPGCAVPSAAEKAAPKKSRTYTEAFSQGVIAAAERDPRVVAITAAMPEGTGLSKFAERFPGRFFDTGITEQHAVAFAAGLARAGARPVAAIYSTFLQRGYDQVFQEVLLQGNPVVFAMDRAGLVGQDGPTHNGLFDIAYLRTMPGVVLMSPRDGTELQRMLDFALTLPGPSAIRYPRGGSAEESSSARTPVELGKAEVLVPGRDATILAYGPIVEQALEARRLLKANGFEVEVVNARFAKPLDRALLRDRVRTRRAIVTVEEHAAGGFGSAVLEAAAELGAQGLDRPARILAMTVPDRWIEHATTREEQIRHCGLDGASIAAKVEAVLGRGTRETAAVS
ncbi:MAG TPA: 1-deoxy-D-xylulose-5-phosphate synthase [Planctomycetota bacterium]|nr:1-deoxy-D-xylulose-5-phosphate synthase [Planctomycetota bacterium]